ncbi:MAG: 4-alpha-glucanotransferase, partial [Candidatus Limnocylindria bacterium]
MPDRTPAATAGAWGVAGSYRDVFGRRQRIGSRIRRRVLDAMGIELGEPPPDRDVVQVMRPGQALAPGTELAAEDGSVLGSLARLPDDLPFGYYRAVHGDVTRLVLVPPPHCVLPSRGWGWAAQAYAARSAASWGIGDLGDLRTLAEWSAASGASFVAISPLFAANPAPEPEPSPYFATTRRFLSPLALRIEEVPGAESAGHLVRTLARRGRALNAGGGIDRARVQTLKLDALREIWERGGGRRLLRTREAAA